ncbi:tripartite tricarboxylate transporter substrate binding protein [Allopusillimonas soli]|uniref:Tripartite tricarboxylate transporter substrate binding protein n=1 Tax=Allopusillimonas soli TaxID=659016 RepID=A0A853FDI1_9BURK|nr:tripartite tricarboxylate transporter substrate binding protein [Allopusillimonas soli]NYT36126.1 tripartite tricarboxylate transporter substrate binding protein [Allopusillimonas soli]TEA76461.1 tripartite tricarboxylate transporter substrate binding protein [Allopusillimonas soli]
MHRRRFLNTVLGIAATAPHWRVMADDFPSRPIRWVVPYPPGGSTDTVARTLGEHMASFLGQRVIVENKPGAASNIGTEAVIRAPADGYTLLLAVPPLAVNPALYPDLGFDALEALQAVCLLVWNPNVLVVPANSKIKSAQQLLDEAKANPDTVTVASPGIGTVPHLVSLLIGQELGIDIVPVPYKGSAALKPDLISGRVYAAMDNLFAQVSAVRSGQVRALATLGHTRSPLLPDVPSMAELGLTDLVGMGWIGVVIRSDVMRERRRILEDALIRSVNVPSVSEKLGSMGLEVIAKSHESYQQFLQTEASRWQSTIRKAGVSVA